MIKEFTSVADQLDESLEYLCNERDRLLAQLAHYRQAVTNTDREVSGIVTRIQATKAAIVKLREAP